MGLIRAKRISHNEPVSTKEKLNVALIGLGRAGQFHLQSLRMISGLHLVAVADVDESRAAHTALEERCRSTTEWMDVIHSEDVDGVIIASPTHCHFEQITAALDNGKAVFTEKPLGTSLEQIDACFSMAADKHLPLFVGFNRRFDPTFASLAGNCQEGVAGRLQCIRVTSRDSPLPTMDYIRHSHGIFHDCIVHDFDMLRYITRRDPVEIYATGSSFVEEIGAMGDFDNVMVTLRYPDGLLASIDVNRFASYGYDQRIEVFGDKGMIQAENRTPSSTVIADREGFTRPAIEYSFPTRYREAYRLELEAFLKCMKEKSAPPVTHHDVRMSFVLCELGETACRENRPIRVDSHPAYQPAT